VCLVHWFYATLPSCDKTFFVKGRSFSIWSQLHRHGW
jgi:hypothetical protein